MSVKDFAGARDGFIEDTIDHISEQGLENSATNLIMPGAIIICMRMGLGKYARLKKPTAINQDLRAIWLSDDVLADYFLYFYSTLKIEGTGTTVKGIKRNELLSYPIPLPPIDEQRRIVSRLDAIMPLIAELESAENELEALERRFPGDMRDSLLQAAIEGRLTGSNTDNWRYVRLGDVISLISGTDLPTDQHNTVGNGTAYITGASNIVNGSLVINRWTTTPKKIAKRGDILLTCKGTIGANCILELEEAHIARQVMAIRVMGADTKFVHYYIQHYVDTLKNQAKSMIPGIERKNITEAPFPLPPIDEQHKIVARLNELIPLCDAIENLS